MPAAVSFSGGEIAVVLLAEFVGDTRGGAVGSRGLRTISVRPPLSSVISRSAPRSTGSLQSWLRAALWLRRRRRLRRHYNRADHQGKDGGSGMGPRRWNSGCQRDRLVPAPVDAIA